MISKIVAMGHGSYTHDDVFKMDLSFAYMLLLSKYESDLYYERAELIRRELNK